MQVLWVIRVRQGIQPKLTWKKNYPKCMGIIRVQLKFIMRRTFIKKYYQTTCFETNF